MCCAVLGNMTYDGLQIEVYDLTTVFLQEEEKNATINTTNRDTNQIEP